MAIDAVRGHHARLNLLVRNATGPLYRVNSQKTTETATDVGAWWFDHSSVDAWSSFYISGRHLVRSIVNREYSLTSYMNSEPVSAHGTLVVRTAPGVTMWVACPRPLVVFSFLALALWQTVFQLENNLSTGFRNSHRQVRIRPGLVHLELNRTV